MDKHDRPYRCYEPGCNRGQGFTYPGGLLPYRREVHKNYTNAIISIMCPYTDCNRSSGNGFKRRESLGEHLYRRHRRTDDVNRVVSWKDGLVYSTSHAKVVSHLESTKDNGRPNLAASEATSTSKGWSIKALRHTPTWQLKWVTAI